MSAVTISPLRTEAVPAVAKLHASELRYSFNSMLGAKHLAGIYRTMSALPYCFVGVALEAGVPVGIVSGTLDERLLKSAVLRSMSWRGMIGGLLCRPSAGFALLKEMKPCPSVQAGDRVVTASLTAIAVATSHRREGLASQLVAALEEFFRGQGVTHYRLDTIAKNTGARGFYRKLGFVEAVQSGQTIILLKQLNGD